MVRLAWILRAVAILSIASGGCGSAMLPPDGGADAGGGSGRGGSTGGQGGVGGTGGVAGSAGIGGTGGIAGTVGVGGVAGSAGAGGSGGAACNPTCDTTRACIGGVCLLTDAQQCVTASQCASGACNPFYRDVDGDGYGTGQAVGFCTLITPPIGYAAQTGDCCDDAANIALAKLIHPGSDFQLTSAGGICGGITWDYDCNGIIEKAGTYCNGCTASPDCQCVVTQFADIDCGNNKGFPQCSKPVTAGGVTCVVAGGNGVLSCR
jgi:hypothetical protein